MRPIVLSFIFAISLTARADSDTRCLECDRLKDVPKECPGPETDSLPTVVATEKSAVTLLLPYVIPCKPWVKRVYNVLAQDGKRTGKIKIVDANQYDAHARILEGRVEKGAKLEFALGK